MRELHGWRRVFRWVKWSLLALVGLIITGVVGVIVFVHTDYARDKIRDIANKQLADLFTGGGSIGKVEGTPFGELVFRDVVINGPDGKPTITIGTLHVAVSIFDLAHKDVKLKELRGEDVEIDVRRNPDGSFQLAQLMRPEKAMPAKEKVQHPESSSWNIDLPDIEVVRGHVRIDTGQPDLGIVDLDDVVIDANAELHGSGTRAAGLRLGATWRQRHASITVLGNVRDDAERTLAPYLAINFGGVTIAATDLTLIKALPGKLPGFSGSVVVGAPAAAVSALVPRLQLPGDVALTIQADHAVGSTIPLAISAKVGDASLEADARLDLADRHVTGNLHTNEIDARSLTHDELEASGIIAASFDVTAGVAGELPTAGATITGHATYQDLPRAGVTATVETRGQQITVSVALTGPARAKLDAVATRSSAAIHLDRGTLVATVVDPMRATAGRVLLHGGVSVDLSGRGALLPRLDLAVDGRIGGSRLRYQDLSVQRLALAIDATHLPGQPHGHAELTLTDIVRGELQLGQVDVKAHDRSDGRLAVEIESRPKQAPWMIELAAIVTPPGRGDRVTVDLGRHRIRAGNGTIWNGVGGRFMLDPEQVSVIGVESHSDDGRIAVDATVQRRGAQNLTARVDVEHFALAALGEGYRGTLDLHADVVRAAHRFRGTATVSGRGLALDPIKPLADLDVSIEAKPGAVTLVGSARSADVGKASFDLALAAPRDVTDIGAWKRAGRGAIDHATVAVENIDLARLATLNAHTIDRTARHLPSLPVLGHAWAFTHPRVAVPISVASAPIAGTLNGSFTVTATTAQGDFKISDLQVPQVRGLGRTDAELKIEQPALGQLVSTLTIDAAAIGTVTARAELAVPDDLTNPEAWQKLGTHALHAATIRTGTIAIDPAMLARFGIESTLRGTASFRIAASDGLDTVQLVADVTDLRGTPLAQPVDLHLEGGLDGSYAIAKLRVASERGTVTLLSFEGKLPMTIDRLRAHPADLRTAPLTASLMLEKTSAPALLAIFGRTQITEGMLDGKVDLSGTIDDPAAEAHLVATNLVSRSSWRGQSTPIVKKLVLDASYDGHRGKATLIGEQDTGGTLNLAAEVDPDHLNSGTAHLMASGFELSPLFAFAPDPASAASGQLDANVSVQGFDIRTSKVVGELHLHHARVPIAPSVGTLRRAEIDLAITSTELRIGATGKLGKGDVSVRGTIAVDGVDLTGGELHAVLRHVSPIGALEPTIDSQIMAKIRREGAKWIADITVDKTFVKIGKSSGEALAPVDTPADIQIEGVTTAPAAEGSRAPAPPQRPALIAHVTLNPIQVESDQFRTTLHGKLDITADANALGVTGRVEASSGDLDLFGRRYRIERAAVTFDGTVDPVLAIRIVHDFPDVETITEVRGRLSKPDLQFASNPAVYSKTQLLGFLLGGEPNGDPSSGSARDKATSLGSSIIANQIGGYVKKALPFDLDVLKYEAASATSSAALTVGSWVTHTLFFSFTQHLDPRPDENTGQGTLEYWFTRRLEIEATVGDRNYDGVDLLWRKRY